jgi:O-succinylbenzoic acid--CoA ligase
MIDWPSSEPHIFVNPRMPQFEKNKLNNMIQEYQLDGHIFLATSGSTATQSTDIKWVALKKSAFLTSACSVNKHLNCTKKDIFLNTLPHFHVGGLALFARAYLCGAQIIDIYNENYKWNSKHFVDQLAANQITISSLVPTQVYDLVHHQLQAPPSLRGIVVGGGFLSKDLYMQACKLGWPLLPSYGMTECCSQIATALPDFQWHGEYPALTVLPHLYVNLSPNNRIEIAGESLLSGYILQSKDKVEFVDPKIDGKIMTSDVGEFTSNFPAACLDPAVKPRDDGQAKTRDDGQAKTRDDGQVKTRDDKSGNLLVYGRDDENIKINGENVSLNRLQNILEQIINSEAAHCDGAIISLPDARQGNKIAAVFSLPRSSSHDSRSSSHDSRSSSHDSRSSSHDSRSSSRGLTAGSREMNEFNKLVFPFERITETFFINKIPRTDLGKLQRKLIYQDLYANKSLPS